jgi:hypothetical protein
MPFDKIAPLSRKNKQAWLYSIFVYVSEAILNLVALLNDLVLSISKISIKGTLSQKSPFTDFVSAELGHSFKQCVLK